MFNLMLSGRREGFKEIHFENVTHDYARWLIKQGAIDYWICHEPIGDMGVNEHFSDAAKTVAVSYAIIDNSMRSKDRIFIREDLSI
jgi:hypothetical protein